MLRCEPCRACHLLSANPDCTGSADECKRVVADNFGRPRKRYGDGIVGIGADGIELIGNSEHDAGGVSSVGVEGAIVGQQGEFSVGSGT